VIPRKHPKARKPRKPETLPAGEHLNMAERYLTLAATHIDTAGEIVGTSQADMLACFASNVLQGSLSLIREMRQLLGCRAVFVPSRECSESCVLVGACTHAGASWQSLRENDGHTKGRRP